MDEEQNTEHRHERRTVVRADRRRDRRKYLLPQEHADRALEACRAGVSETHVAKALGINYRTWMRVREEDDRVCSALVEARKQSLMDKECKLQAAVCLRPRHLGEPRARQARLQAAEQHAGRVPPDQPHARVRARAHVREAPGPPDQIGGKWTIDAAARTEMRRSVHPDILSPLAPILDKPGTTGRYAYNAGRIALAEMCKACAAMCEAEDALQTAALRPLHGQRMQRVGDVRIGPVKLRRHSGPWVGFVAAADWTFNRTAKTVDLRLAEMKAHASILEEKMAKELRERPSATADGLSVAQRGRAHPRALHEAERSTAFIPKANDEDDLRRVAAVPSAPPPPSGIGSETSRTVHHQAARQRNSVEQRQARAVANAIERVMKAWNLLAWRYANVLEPAKARIF